MKNIVVDSGPLITLFDGSDGPSAACDFDRFSLGTIYQFTETTLRLNGGYGDHGFLREMDVMAILPNSMGKTINNRPWF